MKGFELSANTLTFLVILLNFAFDEQELFPIYFHFPKKRKALLNGICIITL